MEHLIDIALGTISLRPYVFAFFGAYLLVCVPHIGWRRTFIFTLLGGTISFGSKWLSVHTGFPYGWCSYLLTTSQEELWIAGVPFFDALSPVFLAYSSYATALFILSPLKASRWNLATLETRRLRRSLSVLLLAACLQTMLAVALDPVTLQGEHWFLGQIYAFREVGIHFGVPLSNYGGWLLTSLCLVGTFQVIDARRLSETTLGLAPIPCHCLLGPFLYLSVLFFSISTALAIGEHLLALCTALMYLLPLVIVLLSLFKRVNSFTKDQLGDHLRDYPWSSVGNSIKQRNQRR